MRSTLDAFLADIEELQTFVQSIGGVYATLAQHGDSVVQACRNIRRRLDYIAVIIALYATFETFVDDLAWSHSEIESARNKYSDLCDKLRSKHLRQSADLLSKGRLGEGRYRELTATSVVENLCDCLTGKTPYKLNRHAVIHHDYNLKSQVIQEIFSSLGIENVNALVCRNENMIDWHSASEHIESSTIKTVSPTIIDLRLNDLVDRRNQIAHAGAGRDMGESLDIAEMQARLSFFQAYARSLFDVIAADYLHRYYIESGQAVNLGRPTEGPYQSGTVVVVSKPECKIFRGQPIIGVCENHVHRWGRILEIKVSDVTVDSLEVDSEASSAGLRADIKFTKGTELYVLQKKDEVIWA